MRWPLHRPEDRNFKATRTSTKTVSDLIRSSSSLLDRTASREEDTSLFLEQTVSSRVDEVAAARVHNLLHHSRPSLLVPTTSAHVYAAKNPDLTLQRYRERRAEMRRTSSALEATISTADAVETRTSQLAGKPGLVGGVRSTLSLAGAPDPASVLAPERILSGSTKPSLRVGAEPKDPAQLQREISARIHHRKKGRVKYSSAQSRAGLAIERSLSLGKFL